jgi:hypothetical protein
MAQVANTFSNPGGPSAASTVGNLNGLFKEVYADKMKELIPDMVKLLNMIKFMSKDKQPGNLYHQPVVLGLEHGITFAASDDDAFALLPAIAGAIKDAQVKGSPAVLRSILGYSAASRAAQGGAQAFMDATKFVVGNMLRSMAKKIEIEMLYGQMGYAVIGQNTAVPGGYVSGNVLPILNSEWAPGIWAGSENMPLEIRSNGGTLKGYCNVVSVQMDNRTVTVDAAPAGITTGSGILPTTGDVIWHKGAYNNEFIGIHRIIQQTGLTFLFNIDTSTYNLFKGNQYDAQSGALSFAKLNQAVARSVEKGLEGKVTCLVNPRGWANMLSDQAALRKYDGSYSKKKLENGSEALTFFSQNGEIEIIPSIYVKEGYAYMLSMEDFARVGSTDITFKRPGADGNFFRDLENASGYELRCYTDQAVFCAAPGKQTLITAIVNQA